MGAAGAGAEPGELGGAALTALAAGVPAGVGPVAIRLFWWEDSRLFTSGAARGCQRTTTIPYPIVGVEGFVLRFR